MHQKKRLKRRNCNAIQTTSHFVEHVWINKTKYWHFYMTVRAVWYGAGMAGTRALNIPDQIRQHHHGKAHKTGDLISAWLMVRNNNWPLATSNHLRRRHSFCIILYRTVFPDNGGGIPIDWTLSGCAAVCPQNSGSQDNAEMKRAMLLQRMGVGGIYDDGTAETVFVLTANNVQERTAWNNAWCQVI